jgi:hypothetical protein
MNRLASPARAAGFALVESAVAMALLSLMLGFMFATNAHLLGLLKQGKQSTFATELIQERVEQLRTSVWNDITTPANLVILADQSQARLTSANLPGVSETIRIEPMVNPTNTAIVCSRPATGSSSVTGPVLTSEKSIKVTVTVQWQGSRRTRSRGISTIITNRGA